MRPDEYFSCPRLHSVMRVDRCNEQRAAAKQLACQSCSDWQQYQRQVVQLDLTTIPLAPASEVQRRLDYRASVTWKPDVRATADANVAVSYTPLPLPRGYDRARLARESGVSPHTWDKYFSGQAIRVDSFQRAHAFLQRLYAARAA
jgi:hypothetical protein